MIYWNHKGSLDFLLTRFIGLSHLTMPGWPSLSETAFCKWQRLTVKLHMGKDLDRWKLLPNEGVHPDW
jgi:hypothetical protein